MSAFLYKAVQKDKRSLKREKSNALLKQTHENKDLTVEIGKTYYFL